MAIVPLPSTPRARVPLPLSRDRRDVILPSFPSPFSPSVPSRDSSRPVPTLHRHLDTVPRSVGRAGDADAISRRRRKAPASVVVARAVRTERRRRRREDGEEDGDERLPPRVARAESFARPRRPRASFPHRCHPPAARARGTTRGTSIRRVVRRPSSVVVETRRESVKKKTGARRVPRSLSSRVRSFARARATMWRATTARGAACRRSRPGPSLRFIFLYVRVDTALKRV